MLELGGVEVDRRGGFQGLDRLVHQLARARVRIGMFRVDLERAAVDASALLRTGRPRRPGREG